jgi:hypothetical protein
VAHEKSPLAAHNRYFGCGKQQSAVPSHRADPYLVVPIEFFPISTGKVPENPQPAPVFAKSVLIDR